MITDPLGFVKATEGQDTSHPRLVNRCGPENPSQGRYPDK